MLPRSRLFRGADVAEEDAGTGAARCGQTSRAGMTRRAVAAVTADIAHTEIGW